MGRLSPKDVASRLLILKYQVVLALAMPPQELISDVSSKRTHDEREQLTKAFRDQAAQFTATMKSNGLWSQMTNEEKEFALSTPFNVKPHQHLNAMWSMESAIVLAWAIGMTEFPPFDTQTNEEVLKRIPHDDVKRFISSATLHPEDVIKGKRSLAELWHWRVRTRQMIDEGFPFEPDESMRNNGIRTLDDIVRNTAKLAFDNSDLSETIEGDFPYRGRAFRSLTEEEYQEATSIIMERHKALNWLCGYARGNHWDRTPTET
jgi:hypothetical protein